MIEFKVTYWEQAPYHDLVELSVVFSETRVEVVAMDVATFSKDRWDAARGHINGNPHGNWSQAYGGTPLREHVDAENLEAATMMAFGALHVLTPSSADAALLEANSGSVAAKYTGKILSDGMGNDVRVMPLLSPAELDAANELMMKGHLQKLAVVVTPEHGKQFTYAAFFRPFNVPVTADGDLSDNAHNLKRKIPMKPSEKACTTT